MSKTKTIFKTVLCMSAFVALIPSCEAGFGKWCKDHLCCCFGGSTEAQDVRATELTIQPQGEPIPVKGPRKMQVHKDTVQPTAPEEVVTTSGAVAKAAATSAPVATKKPRTMQRHADTPTSHVDGKSDSGTSPKRKGSTDGL